MKKEQFGLLRVRDQRTHKLELKRNLADDKIDNRKVALHQIKYRQAGRPRLFPERSGSAGK